MNTQDLQDFHCPREKCIETLSSTYTAPNSVILKLMTFPYQLHILQLQALEFLLSEITFPTLPTGRDSSSYIILTPGSIEHAPLTATVPLPSCSSPGMEWLIMCLVHYKNVCLEVRDPASFGSSWLRPVLDTWWRNVLRWTRWVDGWINECRN